LWGKKGKKKKSGSASRPFLTPSVLKTGRGGNRGRNRRPKEEKKERKGKKRKRKHIDPQTLLIGKEKKSPAHREKKKRKKAPALICVSINASDVMREGGKWEWRFSERGGGKMKVRERCIDRCTRESSRDETIYKRTRRTVKRAPPRKEEREERGLRKKKKNGPHPFSGR